MYSGQTGSETRLYLRLFEASSALPLPGTEGARQPFFSPDGRHLAFFAGTELRRVDFTGGMPALVAEVPAFRRTAGYQWFGGSWGPEDTILYSLGTSLWKVGADGNTEPVELSLTLEDGLPGTTEASVVTYPIKWPHFLPGGQHVLVSLGWEDQAGVTGVVDIATGQFRPLLRGGEPHYLQTGHLLVAG